MKTLLALLNPNSGPKDELTDLLQAIRVEFDEDPEWTVLYQMSLGKEDGAAKIRKAKTRGVDGVLLAGGDGLINSCLEALMDVGLPLYLLPTGSLNGFARHFDIPLQPEEALRCLKHGQEIDMDVGMANDRPFAVTCSFAWEVDIAETFENLNIRGVLPYIFSAAMTGIRYEPQSHRVEVKGIVREEEDPLVLTVANITDYGGLRLIAPPTSINDGKLELIRMDRDAMGSLLSRLPNMLKNPGENLEEIQVESESEFTIVREHPAPVQLDGELVQESAEVRVTVRPRALRVRLPDLDGFSG